MLLDACPELAVEWADDKDISAVSTGSSYPARWRCARHDEHVWTAAVRKRISRGDGCPFCSNKRVLPGFNDLATLYPVLKEEWADERDIRDVLSGSGYVATWRCRVDAEHVWTAAVNKRSRRGDGCPECSNRKIRPGSNDLATLHPHIAAQLVNPADGQRYAPGSPALVEWRCDHGHVYQARIADRVSRNVVCGYCAGKLVWPGFNDLATTHPVIAAQMRDASVLPTDVIAGSKTVVGWQCEKGHEWRARVANRAQLGAGCPQCAASSFVSGFEREVANYVASLGIETEMTVRHLTGISELDIFVPSLSIAIECHGVYWHSERFKPKGAHAAKRAACEALGIRLIQVWQDDWADRRQVVERMLAHKLGVSAEPRIAARATTARTATTAEAREFLEENHIQGFTVASHYLALEHDGRLVALMSLKRTGKPGELRLERYATAAHVLGGQSKLIRHAERTIPGWSHLVTFADYEVSDGSLYERTGWVKDGELAPDYKYRVGNRREHKFSYRLARFRSDPALKFEEGLSERQLAQLNGLDRIWDSGKTRYLYTCGAVPS